ncbi:MAG: UDP-glucose/GDP-mannose dehydrogenase family protein [bacterium]|nr:UDP-glucose/GDP-mannose dehydrogenase family protein [bacterium]
MKITVFGAGYVGLVTGACLSDLGNDVILVDVVKEKIDNLKNIILPIYEPGLEEIIRRNYNKKRLLFTTDSASAITNAEIIFIAVGTPQAEDGQADLNAVRAVATEIGKHINNYKIIVNKSTVPVGSGDLVANIISNNQKGEKIDFDVISNPEFLREGCAIQDFMQPDRIIIGSSNNKASQLIVDLYNPLETTVLVMDVRSAEMVKYASNSFLATKISFINEIANICELVGADVGLVAGGMGLDKRIAHGFLHAGIGFGGSCFPKDCQALIKTAQEIDYDFKVLKSTLETNYLQRTHFIKKIIRILGNVEGKKLGILGLSFKSNTDDMRDAPSIDIINELVKNGALVTAFDPVAIKEAKKYITGINFATSSYQVAEGSEALIILTDWNEFKQLDLLKIKELLKSPIIIDGRNIYVPSKMKDLGFKYYTIGRGKA